MAHLTGDSRGQLNLPFIGIVGIVGMQIMLLYETTLETVEAAVHVAAAGVELM
ncbi:MAG: hypothetical protein R3E84_01115 [Pseudomonadales bacterium]|nr:hypothetical protein [Pseudomonadales bacterium]